MTTTRMPKAQRREQILAAATKAFARNGFVATGLDEVAAETGVSRVILYRHFDSKAELYRAALDRARTHLSDAVGPGAFTEATLGQVITAAANDPAAFRLLFRHAAREPEFRDQVDQLSSLSAEVAHQYLAKVIPDERWARWASRLVPVVAIEAVLAWLDAGQPDPEQAATRIRYTVQSVVEAANNASLT